MILVNSVVVQIIFVVAALVVLLNAMAYHNITNPNVKLKREDPNPTPEPVLVHFWEGKLLDHEPSESFWFNQTGLDCYVSYQRKHFKKAKVVLFSFRRVWRRITEFGPSYRLPARAFPEQLYGLYIPIPPRSDTAEELMPCFSDFNFTVGYRFHDRVARRSLWRPTGPLPALFPQQDTIRYNWEQAYTVDTNFSRKDPVFIASYWAHQCRTRSNRDELAKALIGRGVRVAGFGFCARDLPGADYPVLPQGGRFNPDGVKEKMELLPRFKFYFAFENCLCEDYISEKVWQALVAGTVPVFWGDPRWRSFPENSVIYSTDFLTLDDLAEHLKKVAADEKLYAEYHSWRLRPPTGEFAELLAAGPAHRHMASALCNATVDPYKALGLQPGEPLKALPIGGPCDIAEQVFQELRG